MKTCPSDTLARAALLDEPESALPAQPPKVLVRPEARACYRTLRADNLHLRSSDYEMVVSYSLAYQRLMESTWVLQETGMYVTSDDGKVRPHPALTTVNQASNTMANLGCKLGLSNASRKLEPKHTKPETAKKQAAAGGIRLVS